MLTKVSLDVSGCELSRKKAVRFLNYIFKLPAARFQHILAANPPKITDELSSKVDFATDDFVMEYLFPNLDVDEWVN